MSLLEVLIALAIFLGAMATLSEIASQGMRVATEVQWESEAVLRAESQMNAVLAGVLPMQSAQAVFEDNAKWQWNLVAAADSLHPDLLRLDMQVTHLDSAGQPTYTFALARYVRNPDVYLNAASSSSSSDGSSLLQGVLP
jgi:general secretion pathway protein I